MEENKPELKPFEETTFSGIGFVCVIIAMVTSCLSGSVVAFIVFCLMLVAMLLFSASRTIQKQAREVAELRKKNSE